MGLGQRIRSRPGRLSGGPFRQLLRWIGGGEYRRVHAPRSALSLPKIPRRTQTASSGNIVWEWKLCWAIDPAPFSDGSSGSGPQRALERHHPNPPGRFSAKAPPVSTFPASAESIPNQKYPGTAGAVRSKRWNVITLIPLARSARKLYLSPRSLRAQDRSREAPRHSPRAPASASLSQLYVRVAIFV